MLRVMGILTGTGKEYMNMDRPATDLFLIPALPLSKAGVC